MISPEYPGNSSVTGQCSSTGTCTVMQSLAVITIYNNAIQLTGQASNMKVTLGTLVFGLTHLFLQPSSLPPKQVDILLALVAVSRLTPQGFPLEHVSHLTWTAISSTKLQNIHNKEHPFTYKNTLYHPCEFSSSTTMLEIYENWGQGEMWQGGWIFWLV